MRGMIPDNHKEDPQFLPLSVDTVHLTKIRSSLICGKNDLKMGQNGSNTSLSFSKKLAIFKHYFQCVMIHIL